MDTTTHIAPTRPRLTAAALVLAPTLVAVGDLLAGHEASTASGVLADVAAAPQRFWLSRLVFYVGMLLLLPGVITLLRLVPRRGRRLATVGAVLTGLGALGYGGGEFMLGSALPMLTDPSIPRPAALAAYEAGQADLVVSIPFLLGLGAYVGLALVGGATLRAHTVPRALGIALTIAPLLWFAGAAGSYTIGAIGSLPLLVTYAVLASRVVRVRLPHTETVVTKAVLT